jgi:hypothetical protein
MRRLAVLPLALAFVSAVAVSGTAQTPAASIDVPPGAHAVLEAKGDGVQIYTCSDGADVFKWVLKGPNAKLLDPSGKQIGTHFAGPTWKLTDGSQVQGELAASRASGEANSVPWLLLRAKAGTATGSFASVAFIRRTDTHGGVAPAASCAGSGDLNKTVEIPYTATYTFYSLSDR